MTSEQARISEDRLESLGRAMRELAHDLANEIVVLQGWAHLARGEAEAGRVASDELDRLTDVADSVGRMLHDLLTVAEGQPISPEIGFSPHTVTEATIAQRVIEISSLTVRLRSGVPADARVRGFASFWARILANLLSNSARHARSQVLVSLESAGDEFVLRVEDDGHGLDPSVGAGVLDAAWSGSDSGIGLGLRSVAWLTEQLGGTVRHLGKGSLGGAAFEIRVPRAEPLRGMDPASSVDFIRGSRVLLVDDDAGVRRSLSRLLRRIGADVQEIDPAGRRDDTLLADVCAARAHVILLDLRMGGRDGATLWRGLEARAPEIARRTVFVSGAISGDADWDAAAACGQPMLAKPFTLQQLAQTIAELG